MSSKAEKHSKRSESVSPNMEEDARKALNEAFDALSEWRNETAKVAERSSSKVLDKMTAASKAMGWPAEFTEATRQQLEQAKRAQLQMMDQAMDAWEQQIQDSTQAVSNYEDWRGSFPGSSGTSPGFSQTSREAVELDPTQMFTNPVQFWMQSAEAWQNGCWKSLAMWIELQRSAVEATGKSMRR